MIRRGTLLIWGHKANGQGQLWISVYKTLGTIKTVFTHSISNFTCKLWMMRRGTLLILGHKVKVNFGTLCIKLCGHYKDYSFCPITFKLYMHIIHDERRKTIDFGSKVKVNFGTLCIKPCGHDTNYTFLPNYFQTSNVSCGWWEVEPSWFWVTGSKVKFNFGTLCIKLCRHY